MQLAKRLKASAQLFYYRYELTTALYMLEFWEKCIFNVLVVLGFVLCLYTSINYMPEAVNEWARNAADYFPTLASALNTSLGIISPPIAMKVDL
ncbi:hypothetical protein AMAG_16720 [Allomyces macrogynus ATCC 38327]|uniref:Serine palmitoyltransferase small subunit A n=1 Tax=Allomyces macrogynus (strain ATCC 38327) TaxID=578462 RepID=A0A0L0TBQ0_ALLM3|nr:hypothetical protein GGF32_005164 [Allomyces javanicus]KNE72238.1 hypothetical protein AMAG_16720 [Allomyces macrogynus ATCC 38327]|eukprot:KNE72238.1 hypothetical protein AMAG_16720 [Allomyces macrogynus ATCC 38327]